MNYLDEYTKPIIYTDHDNIDVLGEHESFHHNN